jgi:FixJ family two-component response regulator
MNVDPAFLPMAGFAATEVTVPRRRSANHLHSHAQRVGKNQRRESSGDLQKGGLVCVVDDDGSIRRGLARLFRSAKFPVETFESAQAYLGRPAHDGPSCLVLDVRMPGLDGLELQQTLINREAQIVFITGHGDVPMCAKAMKAGAVDFLTKPVDDDTLLAAVLRAMERATEIRKAKAKKASARARLDKLTPREFEVMQRVIAGLLNKQIADELGAAEKTIKIHRGRVMEKMGVTSVADLVRVAQIAGVRPAHAAA